MDCHRKWNTITCIIKARLSFQFFSFVEYYSIDVCKPATDLQEHIIISNRNSGLESKKFKVFPAVHHMPWFGNFDGRCWIIWLVGMMWQACKLKGMATEASLCIDIWQAQSLLEWNEICLWLCKCACGRFSLISLWCDSWLPYSHVPSNFHLEETNRDPVSQQPQFLCIPMQVVLSCISKWVGWRHYSLWKGVSCNIHLGSSFCVGFINILQTASIPVHGGNSILFDCHCFCWFQIW